MSEPIVDAHCHLWIDAAAGIVPRLADETLARRELAAFREAGGSAVIDCQPGRCGRDGRVLVRLAAATGVEIHPATGFHLERYYAPGDSPYAEKPEALADRWAGELVGGLAEAPRLRARVVKSAWTGGRDPLERILLEAAAEAAARCGAGLVVHTERGAGVEELAVVLAGTRQPPERVQISHVDKRPDAGLHRELATAGFTLGYDAFLRPSYRPLETTWPLLEKLASAGLWERVTVGLDLVDAQLWSVEGGAGLPAIARAILPRLRERVGEQAARALTGGNAIHLLDGAEVAA